MTKLKDYSSLPAGVLVLGLNDEAVLEAVRVAAVRGEHYALLKHFAERHEYHGDDIAGFLLKPYSERKPTNGRERHVIKLIEQFKRKHPPCGEDERSWRDFMGWPNGPMPTDADSVKELAAHPDSRFAEFWHHPWESSPLLERVLKGDFQSLDWSPVQFPQQRHAIVMALMLLQRSAVKWGNIDETERVHQQERIIEFLIANFTWAYGGAGNFDNVSGLFFARPGRLDRGVFFEKVLFEYDFRPYQAETHVLRYILNDDLLQKLARYSTSAAKALGLREIALTLPEGIGATGWVTAICERALLAMSHSTEFIDIDYKLKEFESCHPVEKFAIYCHLSKNVREHPQFPFGGYQISAFDKALPGIKPPRRPTLKEAKEYLGRLPEVRNAADIARRGSKFRKARAFLGIERRNGRMVKAQ